LNRKLLVIDPGHGGHDLGEVDERGRTEKDFNLMVGKNLAEIFLKKGHEVIMTRDEDIAVSLAKRVALANRREAELFVSLHRKSFLVPQQKGVIAYYYKPQYQGLAQAIQAEIAKILLGEKSESKVEKFYVLKHTQMPSVLVEAISSNLTPTQLAQAVFFGVNTYWEEES